MPEPRAPGNDRSVSVWRIAAVEPRVIRSARTQFSNVLRTARRSDDEIEIGTIILGELLANACEHGSLPVGVELRELRGQFTLAVTDAGDGITRPPRRNPTALRGRGFAIIEALGARITFFPRPRSRVEVMLPFRPADSRAKSARTRRGSEPA